MQIATTRETAKALDQNKKRRITQRAKDEFKTRLLETDWDFVTSEQNVNIQWSKMQEFLQSNYDKLFPIVTTRAKTGEPMFFNADLCKMHKKVQ